MSKKHPDRVRELLFNLLEASPYIKASALVRVSGLSVMSIMPPDVEGESVSAMAATMLLLGERITQAMQSGQLDKVYIKGEDGHIILMSVGHEALLTVMAKERAPLGLLFVEMRLAAEKLKRLV
jgi:hypothetical protein